MKRAMRFMHPGELLREEVINANELTVTEAARLLGISRQTLNHIVNLKSDITPDIAFRISKVLAVRLIYGLTYRQNIICI